MTRIRSLNQQDLKRLEQEYTLPASITSWLSVEHALTDDALDQLHRCTCGALILFNKDLIEKAKRDFTDQHLSGCWHRSTLLSTDEAAHILLRRQFDLLGYASNSQSVEALAQAAPKLLALEPHPADMLYSARRLQAVVVIDDYQQKNHAQKAQDHMYHAFILVDRLIKRAHKANEVETAKFAKHYTTPLNIQPIVRSIQIAMSKSREAQNILNTEAYYRVSGAYSPAVRWESEQRRIELSIDSYVALVETTGVLEMIESLLRIIKGDNFIPHPFTDDKKGHMKTTILLDCNNQALHKYIEQSFDYDFRNDTAGHNDYDILLKQRKIVSRQHRTRYKFHDFNTNLGRVMGMVEALLTLTNTYSYRQDEAALATKGVYAISAAQDGTNNLYFLQSWCNADLDFNRSTSLTVKFSYRSQHNTVLMSFWYGSRKLSATFFQPTISSIDFFASVLHQNSIEMHRAWVAPRMHYFANHVLSKIDLGEQTYYIIDGDTQTLGIKKNNVRYIIGRLRQVTLPPDIAATS